MGSGSLGLRLLKKEVFQFFRRKFVEGCRLRPHLFCHGMKELSEEEAEGISSPFTEKEIKEAVFWCGDDKAPGPDGFNFKFIKRFWSCFSGNFLEILQRFYETGTISPGVGSSFITLVPKSMAPIDLTEYRPINLIGVVSKVISKVLANRLKMVTGKITEDTQSAFLTGIFILDGPLVINEITNWAKRLGKNIFMMQIDFEKAYDNVHWEFLLDILHQKGFPSIWCDWIRGDQTGEPAFAFLVSFVMEAFTCIFRKASDVGVFEGIQLPNNGPKINHLLYADDAMILGEWSNFNFNNVKRMLRVFYLCPGLKININKSTLYGIGVDNEEVLNHAVMMGCKAGLLPFVYLGINVGANMNRVRNWDPMVEVFRNRLSKWKAQVLSIGGRVTLIKSVLQSLPNYYFSLYKAPRKVIMTLEGLIKKFLRGGSDEVLKMHWVAWEKVATPRTKGGLGLNKLEDCNNALMLKWLWRYRVEYDSLWKKVIEAIRAKGRKWNFYPMITNCSGSVWSSIVKLGYKVKIDGQNFGSLIRSKLGDGKRTRFWLDPWVDGSALKRKYPNLFRIEEDKSCTVSDRVFMDDGICSFLWQWRRPIYMVDEILELTDLTNKLAGLQLADERDEWQWHGSKDGFSVAATKSWLSNSTIESLSPGFKWVKWIPIKCNIFMWRALMERIPTKDALVRRNIYVADTGCVFCSEADETAMHMFTACAFSTGIWQAISRWCGIPYVFAFEIKDLLDIAENCGR
ncbi:putative RNA-directed DNA polymerase [Helianthus annuus]|nr:putative RNA-directed DNA polymerase [Helianthus annuus]